MRCSGGEGGAMWSAPLRDAFASRELDWLQHF